MTNKSKNSKQKNSKRFIALKSHKGIKKDTKSGKYLARKTIKGKEYSKSFEKLSEALEWRKIFDPQGITIEREKMASCNSNNSALCSTSETDDLKAGYLLPH